jgi:hypothetical protein
VLSAICTQQAKVKVLSYFWVLVCFCHLTLVIDLFWAATTSQEVNVEAPIKTALVGDVATTVDAEFAMVSVEKRSTFSVLLVPEVLMMLMKDDRRCEFGICFPRLVIYSHFGDFVNFGCHVQASSSHLIVTKPKASVVDVSSSDTDDLLNSLFLSPLAILCLCTIVQAPMPIHLRVGPRRTIWSRVYMLH